MTKRVMVFGGTSGIGAAVADRLLDRDDEPKVRRRGHEDYDILNTRELQHDVREFQPTHVVYSVGVHKLDWIQDIDGEDFKRLMLVNVGGFVAVLQALMHTEWDRAKPSIVAITSDAAYRPMRTSLSYCASKAALDMAVRVASRELAPVGWRVNAVAPGKVANTPMTEYVDKTVPGLRGWTVDKAVQYELESSPLSRAVTPEEVAEVVESVLFGPQALTGEIIAVNGGR